MGYIPQVILKASFEFNIYQKPISFEFNIYQKSISFECNIYQKVISFEFNIYQKSISFEFNIYQKSISFEFNIYRKSISFECNIYQKVISFEFNIYQKPISFEVNLFPDDNNYFHCLSLFSLLLGYIMIYGSRIKARQQSVARQLQDKLIYTPRILQRQIRPNLHPNPYPNLYPNLYPNPNLNPNPKPYPNLYSYVSCYNPLSCFNPVTMIYNKSNAVQQCAITIHIKYTLYFFDIYLICYIHLPCYMYDRTVWSKIVSWFRASSFIVFVHLNQRLTIQIA